MSNEIMYDNNNNNKCTLQGEIRNHSMHRCISVTETRSLAVPSLTSTQASEILGRDWELIGEKLENDSLWSTSVDSLVTTDSTDSKIEKDKRVGLRHVRGGFGVFVLHVFLLFCFFFFCYFSFFEQLLLRL